MSAALTYAAYAVLAAAAVALEVAGAAGRTATLGRLGRGLTARVPTLTILFLGWAWTGWHLFARGTVRFLR